MIDYEDYIDEIVKWNTDTFPDNTFVSQWNKIVEERNEILNAETIDDYMYELADYFIAVCGMIRFNEDFARDLLNIFVKNYEVKGLNKYIEEKIKINKNRKWVKINGVYKHEGEI